MSISLILLTFFKFVKKLLLTRIFDRKMREGRQTFAVINFNRTLSGIYFDLKIFRGRIKYEIELFMKEIV